MQLVVGDRSPVVDDADKVEFAGASPTLPSSRSPTPVIRSRATSRSSWPGSSTAFLGENRHSRSDATCRRVRLTAGRESTIMKRCVEALAAAVLGLSLWVGSLAWSGFVMTRTVLDPGRSEAVAEALLENDAVRDQLVANIASGVEATLPEGAPVDGRPSRPARPHRARVAAGRGAVPRRLRPHPPGLPRRGRSHPNRSTAARSARRPATRSCRPVPSSTGPPGRAELPVPLPTDRIPNLGGVRKFLLTAIPVLAGVAALGALLALLVTSNRPAVIRRAGLWAIGLSAVILIFAYGIPALAEAWRRAVGDHRRPHRALAAGATRGPAVALGGRRRRRAAAVAGVGRRRRDRRRRRTASPARRSGRSVRCGPRHPRRPPGPPPWVPRARAPLPLPPTAPAAGPRPTGRSPAATRGRPDAGYSDLGRPRPPAAEPTRVQGAAADAPRSAEPTRRRARRSVGRRGRLGA